jgi:hypothetical protein
VQAGELINSCVSPQWHRGPWQAMIRALRRDLTPLPPAKRFRILYMSRAGSKNGRAVLNEDAVVQLIGKYTERKKEK